MSNPSQSFPDPVQGLSPFASVAAASLSSFSGNRNEQITTTGVVPENPLSSPISDSKRKKPASFSSSTIPRERSISEYEDYNNDNDDDNDEDNRRRRASGVSRGSMRSTGRSRGNSMNGTRTRSRSRTSSRDRSRTHSVTLPELEELLEIELKKLAALEVCF